MKKPNVFIVKVYHCTTKQKRSNWKRTKQQSNERKGVGAACGGEKNIYSCSTKVIYAYCVFGCMTTTTTATVITKPSIITTSQAISKQRNYGNYSVGRVSRCYFAHTASIARSVFFKLFIISHNCFQFFFPFSSCLYTEYRIFIVYSPLFQRTFNAKFKCFKLWLFSRNQPQQQQQKNCAIKELNSAFNVE